MKYLSLILIAVAFTVLLVSLYPFRQKYSYPAALPTPTPVKYSCPPSEWVDCMPSPDSPPRPQCQSDYLQWAITYCPNFKGAAL